MGEFRMPSLGADMDEGTIVEWRVKPGDTVERGDIVAVVDTEKSDIEVEIWESGTVQQILVPEGETVPVGTPLAVLGTGAATEPAPTPEPEPEPEVEAQSRAVEAQPHAPVVRSPLVRKLARELDVDLDVLDGTGPGGAITRSDVEKAATPATTAAPATAAPSRVAARGGERVPSSPLARRRAEELGLELTQISGSGPGGAVTADDVERTASGTPTSTAPSSHEPAPEEPGRQEKEAAAPADRAEAMRQAIARLMARSKREIPHYYLESAIDVGAATAWLEAANRDRPVPERILPAALLLKATALAARRFPDLNGFWIDDRFQPADPVHLGVAIALRGGGLVAPAIHDADQLGVDQIMAALRDLVTRARAGRLRGSEMSDPTLTVTNLGEQGADLVHGVIYAPQVALVGFGRIVERPWAVDGMLTVRPVVQATLAADHRASDGHLGARLLGAIDQLLQTPEEL